MRKYSTEKSTIIAGCGHVYEHKLMGKYEGKKESS